MSDITKILPIEKLIDVVASGIGAVAGPMILRRQAKAEADAIKMIAKAQAEAKEILKIQNNEASNDKISTQVQIETNKNAVQSMIQFQETKRYNNIQNIVAQAKNKLPEQVSNKPVDHDWTARFFQSAQDISTEEMQQIWSSILVGEVETPGRTSLRTLDILKNMTKKEAEIFNKVMKYKIGSFIFHDYLYGENIKRYVDYDNLLILEGINLLNASALISMDFSLLGSNKIEIGRQWGYIFQIYSQLNNSKKTIYIPGFVLRKPALELASFLYHTPDFSYLKLLAKYLKKKENCCLEIGEILREEGLEVVLKPGSLKVIQP